VSKVVHTLVRSMSSDLLDAGMMGNDEAVGMSTETYRALVKSFRETVARLEGEASYHEQDGRPSVASQIFGWCAEAEDALALLREADTEEGA
jgi:hypothetical protein